MRLSKSFRVLHARWAFLAAAGLGSLGCLGKASSRHADEPTPSTGVSETDSAGAGETAAGGSEPGPSPAEALRASLERNYLRQDPALAFVLGLLDGSCNSGMETNGVEVIDFGLLAQLIASGEIVPGSGAASPVVERLRAQLEDPDHRYCLGESQLALLVRFIDELDVTPSAECTPLARLTLDQVQTALAADITAQPESDRAFLRYLSLTYASNAGVCGQELDRERQALFEAVNAVSTGPDVRLPAAVDAQAVLYRVDLRDYGWDRTIKLGDGPNQLYADGWLAIVAGTLRAPLRLGGPQADIVNRWSATRVPLLPAHVFIHSALQDSRYYALSGLDAPSGAERSLFELMRGRGVEMQAPSAGTVARAAFSVSPGFTESKRVSRFSAPGGLGVPWWVLENGTEPSLTREPLLEFQGGMFLYRLPNGMPAFAVAQNQGFVLAQAPYRAFDFSGPTGAIVGAGCFGCHGAGVIVVPDEVQSVALGPEPAFENAEAVLAEYLGSYPLEQAAIRDNVTFATARLRAGLPLGTRDPLSHVFQRFFFAGVSRHAAAAELGVTTDELLDKLRNFDPRLEPLFVDAEATLDRSVWEELYSELECFLSHAPWQNAVVENCEWR